ncbi:pinin/SDK/memA/ protein conserved region-domain-containing protein [Morchella snyderi]|nr:pinin/SDK/memA/ protein conserved region-domain-containing protein [Morchella snyderi]
MLEEEQVTIVASAVVVPHNDDMDRSPPPKLLAKRRQSTASPESSKRARFNHKDHSSNGRELHYPSVDDGEDVAGRGGRNSRLKAEESEDESSRPSRRPSAGKAAAGNEEERRRGKRLFGALLGTIGKFKQDSSSARARNSAVKRREVEAKLQEKLKQQTNEIDERRKKEDQNVNLRRRMEQRGFDERAMQIRHNNELAQAHILQTSALPKLFYLPWKLLPEEEERIKVQVEEAEDSIAQEQRKFQLRREREEEEEQLNGGANNLNEPGLAIDPHHEDDDSPMIDDNDHATEVNIRHHDDGDHTNLDHAPVHDEIDNTRRQSDIGDVGEIVEAGEDTVIY